jgi:tetratricopeptide (TPR) repeat protein
VNLRVAQGRIADAQAEWAALADVAPDSIGVLGLGALLAYVRGDMAEVLAQYRRAADLLPDHAACHAHVAGALALCGDLAGARATLAAIAALGPAAPRNAVSPYVMGIVALRMGDTDAAIEWLQTAADIGDPNVLWALSDPCLDGLRGDTRYAALAATLRLKRR